VGFSRALNHIDRKRLGIWAEPFECDGHTWPHLAFLWLGLSFLLIRTISGGAYVLSAARI